METISISNEAALILGYIDLISKYRKDLPSNGLRIDLALVSLPKKRI